MARFDDVSGDIEKLNEIKAKAEELGLEADDVYPAFDRHMEALNYMKESDDQYKRKRNENLIPISETKCKETTKIKLSSLVEHHLLGVVVLVYVGIPTSILSLVVMVLFKHKV